MYVAVQHRIAFNLKFFNSSIMNITGPTQLAETQLGMNMQIEILKNQTEEKYSKMLKLIWTFPKCPPPKVVMYKKLIISANLFQLTCCLINLPIM